MGFGKSSVRSKANVFLPGGCRLDAMPLVAKKIGVEEDESRYGGGLSLGGVGG